MFFNTVAALNVLVNTLGDKVDALIDICADFRKRLDTLEAGRAKAEERLQLVVLRGVDVVAVCTLPARLTDGASREVKDVTQALRSFHKADSTLLVPKGFEYTPVAQPAPVVVNTPTPQTLPDVTAAVKRYREDQGLRSTPLWAR